MDLYTLDSAYRKQEMIETYHACVWTEQYNNTGNFELVVSATRDNYAKFPLGLHVGNSESKEVGTILTREVKDDKIHLKGPFQLGLLQYRFYRYNDQHEVQYGDFVGTPGELIRHQLQWSCLPGWPTVISNQSRNYITNLVLGSIDDGGFSRDYAVRYGQLLEIILKLSEEGGCGLRLQPTYPTPTSYQLVFDVYYGRDLTREQSQYPAVVFDPALDTLVDGTELTSSAIYYNACYAYAPNISAADVGNVSNVVGVVDNAPNARDWDRRVLMHYADDITTDEVGGSASKLQQKLQQRARDALANNNYIFMADGQIVPQIGYKYGVDYKLGDIVELRSPFNVDQKARIIEYIRSQDQNGYKEYPTLSVITDEVYTSVSQSGFVDLFSDMFVD